MKAAKGGAPDGDGEGDEAAKTQQLNFRKYPEQVEIVEAALAKMKEASHISRRTLDRVLISPRETVTGWGCAFMRLRCAYAQAPGRYRIASTHAS